MTRPSLRQLISHLPAMREFGFRKLLGCALLHGRGPTIELIRNAHLLCRNGLFDRQWYVTQYPGVPKQKALSHFLLVGGYQGHSPGPGFDSAFYLASNPDVAQARMNPALHFEQFGRREGRLPLPPQTPANPETQVVKEDPRAKTESTVSMPTEITPPDSVAVENVPAEETPAMSASMESTPGENAPGEDAPAGIDSWTPERLAAALDSFHGNATAAEAVLALHPPREWLPELRDNDPVEVFVHSAGNIFMREIAELVSAAFTAAGFPASLLDEQSALDSTTHASSPPRLIVAPHEFFLLPGKDGRTVPAEWAKDALLLNVEQLHTDWFRKGLGSLKQARGVFDINLQSAAVLAQAGLPAAFLPLGFVPGFDAFTPASRLPDLPALATLERAIRESIPPLDAPLGERPIDIFFIGYVSPRREGILQRMAERLARWRCHFVLTSADRPLVRGENAILDTGATLGIARRSKIVLNIHQSDAPFFEWHRIVLQGIWQGALVITEPVADQTLFTGGEHFLSAPLDEMAGVLDWVLGTAHGMAVGERIRTQAREQLTGRVRLDQTLRKLFAAPANKPAAIPERSAAELTASP